MKKLILVLSLFSSLALGRTLELNERNTAHLYGEVNAENVQLTVAELAKLDYLRGKADYPIYLVVNSGGGEVDWGNVLLAYAKGLKNVHTISLYAASMASFIVNALPGTRYAIWPSQFMFHDAEIVRPDPESLAYAKKKWFAAEYINYTRMRMTKNQYEAKVGGKEWRIWGFEALGLHVADELVDLHCDIGLLGKPLQNAEGTFSACPAIFLPVSQEPEIENNQPY